MHSDGQDKLGSHSSRFPQERKGWKRGRRLGKQKRDKPQDYENMGDPPHLLSSTTFLWKHHWNPFLKES